MDARLLNVGAPSRPSAPAAVANEANFWLGETLGRLGDVQGRRGAASGVHRVQPSRLWRANGFLSLGWWSRAAGQPADAVEGVPHTAGRLSRAPEAPWARAGLVQALLDLDDYAAAREEARQARRKRSGRDILGAGLAPRSPVARRQVLARTMPGRSIEQLLARTLEPPARAWVLLSSAEQARLAGQRDEARTRFELVRQSPAVPALGHYAALRLAQSDFDLREFARPRAGVKGLLNETLSPTSAPPRWCLAAEAAYWARNYDEAVAALHAIPDGRAEAGPRRRAAPKVVLALGWAELRRGRLDAARQRWTSFAQQAPADPQRRRGAAALGRAGGQGGRRPDGAERS